MNKQTPWLSSPQQVSWRSYLGGSAVLQERLDRDLRESHDLSLAEYEIMVRLSESENRTMRMAELADAVAHSRSRMTHTVTRLERAGYVERQSCANDGRGVEALLTDEGFAKLSDAAHVHVSGVREHFVDTMSDEEFELLGEVMQRVVEKLGGTPF